MSRILVIEDELPLRRAVVLQLDVGPAIQPARCSLR